MYTPKFFTCLSSYWVGKPLRFPNNSEACLPCNSSEKEMSIIPLLGYLGIHGHYMPPTPIPITHTHSTTQNHLYSMQAEPTQVFNIGTSFKLSEKLEQYENLNL